jgi:hypothetical protein
LTELRSLIDVFDQVTSSLNDDTENEGCDAASNDETFSQKLDMQKNDLRVTDVLAVNDLLSKARDTGLIAGNPDVGRSFRIRRGDREDRGFRFVTVSGRCVKKLPAERFQITPLRDESSNKVFNIYFLV